MLQENRRRQLIRNVLDIGCHLGILMLVVVLFSLQILQFVSMLSDLQGLAQEVDIEITKDEEAQMQDTLQQLESAKKELSERDMLVAFLADSPRLVGFFYFILLILAAFSRLLITRHSRIRPRGRLRFGPGITELIFLCLYLVSALFFLILGYGSLSVKIMNFCCCVPMLYSCVRAIWKKRRVSTILLRVIWIFLIAVNLAAFSDLPLFVLAILFLRSVWRLITISVSHIRMDILSNIIRKTHTGEILMGLGLQIVVSSILLTLFDPGIRTYPDALWYCFALVTTIGFGDVTATSILGRILSVFLGIYGIIVVALITSIIVNFYGEVKDDRD